MTVWGVNVEGYGFALLEMSDEVCENVFGKGFRVEVMIDKILAHQEKCRHFVSDSFFVNADGDGLGADGGRMQRKGKVL